MSIGYVSEARSFCKYKFKKKTFLLCEKDGPASFKQPMYILQPINAVNVDNARKIMMRSDSAQEMDPKAKSDGRGQTLTLMEDGSLGMMEVAWNET